MRDSFKNWIINILWRFVKRVIENDQPIIIAVTGSVGKTSTKEAITTILDLTKKPIISARKSLNTEFGIPLTMLGVYEAPGTLGWISVIWKAWKKTSLGQKNYYLILEFGADKPGDIKYLSERIPVDLAIFTTIVPAHLQEFGTVEKVAEEKLILAKNIKSKGRIIANIDDLLQQKYLKNQKNVIWYGHDKKNASIKATKVNVTSEGTNFILNYKNEMKEIKSPLLGSHQIIQLLVATAVALEEKISFSEIVKSLPSIQAKPGRMNLVKGRRGITIIDDSYNSNPEAVFRALEVLAIFKKKNLLKGRRLAILGNMNELGEKEKFYHQKIGKYVFNRADALIAVGPNAQLIAQGAKSAGMKPETVVEFQTTSELLSRLNDVVQSNDVILVKASQNYMRFERVVKALMLNPEKAGTILVRQSKHWQSR